MTTDELKKEAEKSLDKRLGTYAYIRKQDCYTNYVDGYIDSAVSREKRIEQLEKENAELKKERKRLSDNYHHWNIKACHIDQELYDIKRQLTNAKEIIREFMKYEINEYDGSLEIHFEELKKQAEQFLSEVEK